MFKFKIKMITIILLFILHKDIFFRWIDKKDVHIFITECNNYSCFTFFINKALLSILE